MKRELHCMTCSKTIKRCNDCGYEFGIHEPMACSKDIHLCIRCNTLRNRIKPKGGDNMNVKPGMMSAKTAVVITALIVGMLVTIFVCSGCAKKQVVKPVEPKVKSLNIQYPISKYGNLKYFDEGSKEEITEEEYFERLKIWYDEE